MKELLGEDYPAWQDSFLALPVHGIRINELKTAPGDFLSLWKASDIPEYSRESLKPVEWIHNGFYIEDTSVFSGHPLYQAGVYYIQEPSAMTPAELLPIRPGDHVLDLCAAPGGKTTELLSKLNRTGLLYANDISVSRAQALRKYVEMAGGTNAYITAEAPDKLAASFPEFFDKILVDGPCSGEGMFRRKPEMVRDWEDKGPAYYADIQYDILSAAVRMLSPDGMMLFSTCTFSEVENEGNVKKLLHDHPELELCELPDHPGFLKSRVKGAEMCIRVMPHRMGGEGQFVALLHKKCEKENLPPKSRKNSAPKLFPVEDRVYLLPEGHMPRAGIRYLMTGLMIGTVKSGRMSPTQALAQAISADDWPGTLNLKSGDMRLARYLRGESIVCAESEITVRDIPGAKLFGLNMTDRKNKEKGPADRNQSTGSRKSKKTDKNSAKELPALYSGDILVLADGFPVGFGSLNRGLLKNKRNPGWRNQ